MKKLIFALFIMLTGCKASPIQSITSHQPLQATVETNNTSSSTTTPLDTDSQISTTTFANQQEFVDHMYERVQSLEDTLALLNTNLGQIINSDDSDVTLQEIRQTLIEQTRLETEALRNLTPVNDEVTDLHHYVIESYFFNLEDKVAQYEISQAETLEERQSLITANQEIEQLAIHYLNLAWQELNRLSETTYYRK